VSSELTDASGAFTFGDLRARTPGMGGPERAATFYARPAETQSEAWRTLRREVEARSAVARAEVVST
jgi:hypothetical protein